jgi:hypothetical protein
MGAARFRIRVGGREVEVHDLDDVVRLVRAGRIGPATEIWDEHAGAWTVVGALEGTGDPGTDPWSAWEDVDETDPVVAFRAPPDDAPPAYEEPTVPPLMGMEVEPEVTEEPPSEPPPAIEEPAEEEHLAPTGEVIAFPTERFETARRRTSGAHALAERPRPVVPPRPARPEPPRLRLSIVLGTSIVGFLGLGWWVWYVDTTSEVPPGPTSHPVAHPTRTIEAAAPEPPRSPAQTQLRIVEEEMAARLPEATREVASESDLEMALNTELAALGIDLVEANAAVLSWTTTDPAEGPIARIPQVVEFRVRVRPGGGAALTDREQGAVALVIGRYIAAYQLVVTRFDLVVEATDALPRTIPVDAMRAQRLAEGQLDLAEYLRVP